MAKNSLEFTLTGGLDIGNGYTKGLIRHGRGKNPIMTKIDIPSAVLQTTQNNLVPVPDSYAPSVVAGDDISLVPGFDATSDRNTDFFNILDVSFESPLVPDRHRRLFGSRSLSARGAFDEFDLIGKQSKAQQSLSKILVLGIFAGCALKEYVSHNGSLPPSTSALVVHARVALALPINEYLNHRKNYAFDFTGDSSHPVTHTVTIHCFETPVTVKIVFDDVQVIAEGAAAQYAIGVKGEPLMNAMLQDVRSRGVELEGITAADILAAEYTIGIDIGEGTVNFPVFTEGKFNPEASMTMNKGYGSVLTDALEDMNAQGFNTGFQSRKHLAAYLQKKPKALKVNFYNHVWQYVDQHIGFFAEEVVLYFGRVLDLVGATTEVAYVYGGGSGPVKDKLYPLLLSKVYEMNSADGFPVLYLDSSYSRSLNREGLYIAADAVERRNRNN